MMSVAALALVFGAGCGGDKEVNEPDEPIVTPIVPEQADRVVIYEAYPGMFGTSGTLQAIAARLGEIEALGVNVLWLMPTFPQGIVKGIGSPYCVRDYHGVNANYGTLDDMKALVAAAHARGMRVILDWVANHTAWDNPWVTEHPDWYTKNANGEIISPPGTNWTDVADLDFASTEMRAAMIEAMKWWVTEVDIDGYRCDHVDGVPVDFWTAAIAELRTLKTDLFMLAESGDDDYLRAGFDMGYSWSFASVLQGVYGGTKTVADLYAAMEAEKKITPAGKRWMRHITNHDMNNGTATQTFYKSQRGAMGAWVIAAMLGECPMIYSSQEVGQTGVVSFFQNYTTNWGQNDIIFAEYKKLMAIRAGENALQASGTVTTFGASTRIVAFVRSDGVDEILVAVNTSSAAARVSLPAGVSGVKFNDLVSGQSVSAASMLTLQGYEYVIWKKL